MVKNKFNNNLDDQIKKSWQMLENILKENPINKECLLFAIEHGISLERHKSKKEYDDWWYEHDRSLRNQSKYDAIRL